MTEGRRRRPGFNVGFWGARGSISTPGRVTEKYGGNTPCVSVTTGSTWIVFDAGTGIRNLGLELARLYADRPQELVVHLFLSHTHWDHIQGIPFFEPAYMDNAQIVIYGSSTRRGFLDEILKGQMSQVYFPVSMSDLPAQITTRELQETSMDIDGVHIRWEEQIYHPGGSVRYRVEREDACVVYASDIELNQFFVADPTPEQLQHQADYLGFIREADLLIADGQFMDSQYAQVAGYGHSTIELLTDVAYRAGVKRLAVFHHDPRHTDATLDELWQQHHAKYMSKSPAMNIFWAREGQVIPA